MKKLIILFITLTFNLYAEQYNYSDKYFIQIKTYIVKRKMFVRNEMWNNENTKNNYFRLNYLIFG